MKKRHLLVLGLGVFLLAALFNLPARLLHHWTSENLANAEVGLYGLQGSASSGLVGAVEYRARPVVSKLGWQWQKLQLLIGRLSFHLNGGRGDILVDGKIFVLPSGTITLQDFRAAAPVKHLLAVSGLKFAPFGGQVNASLDKLKVRNQWPTHIEGTLTLQNLALELGRSPVLFGNFQALIAPDTGGNKAILSSVSGPVELEGDARITHDRSYQADLRLRARPDAPQLVRNYIKNLGRPDAQGWYQLSYKGTVAVPEQAHVQSDDPVAVRHPDAPGGPGRGGVTAGPIPPVQGQ